MLYTFKALTDSWSVIYDDLAHENSHEISDFKAISQNDKIQSTLTVGSSIQILEPQNCIMYSAVRKLNLITLAKTTKCLLNYIEDNYKDVLNAAQKNNDFELNILYNNVNSYITVVNNKLCMINNFSNVDFWNQFPYDYSAYMIAQMFIANKLNLQLGWCQFNNFKISLDGQYFITDDNKYDKEMKDFYLIGKESIPYFKYFDSRDYRLTLNELLSDIDVILNNDTQILLKNECLNYLLKLRPLEIEK